MSYRFLAITALIVICVVAGCMNFIRTNTETLQPEPQAQLSHGYLLVTQQVVENYKAADIQGILKITVIGRSAQGRPIYLFKLSSGAGRRSVFVMCRQHGHEPGSTIACLQLLEKALADGSMNNYLKNLNIYIVPEANPDGAANYTRWDSRGDDLNRQWTSPSEPEVRAIKSTISNLHPDLVMDMHDLGSRGSFVEIYNDGSKSTSIIGTICRKMRTQIRKSTDPICRVAYSSRKNYPGLAHRVIIHQFGIPAILVESRQSAAYTPDAKCIGTHIIAMTTAFRFLAAK